MQVHLLNALEDNYMYVLVDHLTNETAVVDPVDANRVLEFIEEHNLKLTKLLITHHHWDHAGGNINLLNKYKGNEKLLVYGADQRIPGLNRKIKDNDLIKLGALEIICIFTPCHTLGSVCYFVKKPDSNLEPCVFTGDTLFIGGCGKFFEGNAEQMYDALINKLSKLPDNTKIYCGHEYTLNNLKFALMIDLDNKNLISKYNWTKKKLYNKEPTIPSTIGEEKKYNPFMRVNEKIIQNYFLKDNKEITIENVLNKNLSIEVMKKLRELKNKM